MDDTALNPIPQTPELPAVSREVLHDQIYTILKRNLMMGRFVPGQKLPLRGLARSLGTSLMPVRDALQRLESMGCLTSTTNRTMMVPVFTAKEMLDICTLRMVLEGAAAEKAAIERTDEELESLRHYVDDIRLSAETDNVDMFLEANHHFHMAIAAMSRLAFIGNLLDPLWLYMGPAVRQTVPTQELFWRAVKHHQEAFDALCRHDSAAAVTAIHADIMDGHKF